ncbi:MAG TPA: response regulator transcription factor [Solirubrobacteraceae bacterium]|nr:response regulator transcription factor [Solirubrobacteraceae bacterium]
MRYAPRRAAKDPRVNPHLNVATGHRGTILVVEDEPTIAEMVARYLRGAGFETTVAADGTAAVAAIGARRPDLVVLDVMLPGMSGLDVMRHLRATDQRHAAVVLLTARGGEADRVAGLQQGADDYIVKPFSPAELVARVTAVLRRTANAPDPKPSLRFDDLHIDIAGHRVVRDGEEIALTQREFELLVYLARHAGQVFSRDELMQRVWRYSFYTDTATVTVHVRRLRAKLERDPSSPRWIKTAWGIGYRFQP